MNISCWIHQLGQTASPQAKTFCQVLRDRGIKLEPLNLDAPLEHGLCIFSEINEELTDFLKRISQNGRRRTIAIALYDKYVNCKSYWEILQAGASDVLAWSEPSQLARQIHARIQRWQTVDQLLVSAEIRNTAIGKSQLWCEVLQNIVEIARFSDAPALILGESGTGKEVIANLIHSLDARPDKREQVVVDCSTLVPQLSGSEFFGHERGAFTGAAGERDGAFALADGGTLFLDEIGELPLPMQAQLLRVIQEHTYKRVGGNVWRKTQFRLVCATNRNLQEMVQKGEFRADLYYRIASFVCHLPPLRERLEDIIPLTEHFLGKLHRHGEPPTLDSAVRDYLMRRDYPGNVRELRQVVSRLLYRYTGDGIITLGNIPPDERTAGFSVDEVWSDSRFERAIQRAVLSGLGLKEIGRAAEDIAIRMATEAEDGNIQRAARRLGVTDRALQLRRANKRQGDGGGLRVVD